MEKQLDTDISHISGKVFNKTSIFGRFFGLSTGFCVLRRDAPGFRPEFREQRC